MTSRATYLEQERIARDRAQVERDRAEIEVRLTVTPATIRKRRRPVTQELYTRDAITLDQLRAANEISEIFLQLTQGLHARTSNFSDRVDRSRNDNDWKPGLGRRYNEFYIPWRDEIGALRLRSTATLADLVFDLLLSNIGITQAASIWGMDRRRVLGLLRAALQRYAEVAGWVRINGESALWDVIADSRRR